MYIKYLFIAIRLQKKYLIHDTIPLEKIKFATIVWKSVIGLDKKFEDDDSKICNGFLRKQLEVCSVPYKKIRVVASVRDKMFLVANHRAKNNLIVSSL
jgi:hypothetical protein